MNSKNVDLLPIIHNSFFFKLMKVEGPDFRTIVDETDECSIRHACIGYRAVEGALATHFGQFEEKENTHQWLMNTVPKRLVIRLGSVDFRPEGLSKTAIRSHLIVG
jgi:hypothetical protein